MAIYNLDETPNIFISIDYYDNKFLYRMTQVDGDVRVKIRSIDLRNDKLRIHGNEIQESMFQRLYDSLTFRDKAGIILVNCDGACFIIQQGGRYLRPIRDVIFDWSPFGVIVPNSVNDLLRKELRSTKDELESSIDKSRELENEIESMKEDMKASNNEVFDLKEQVLGYKEMKVDLELKWQKVCEKVVLNDIELELHKVELESCNKEVDRLLGQLCLIRSELHSSKARLESLDETSKELEERLLSYENRNQDMKNELEKVKEQLRMANEEIQRNESLLETSRKEVEELEEQIRAYEKEHYLQQSIAHKMWTQCFSIIQKICHPTSHP